jgi:hypothetical protein
MKRVAERPRIERAVVAAGAGVAFALTRDEEKLCPLAGGMTGVVVRPTAADVRDTTRATVCVEGRCTRMQRRASGAIFPVKASGRGACGCCSCLNATANRLTCER